MTPEDLMTIADAQHKLADDIKKKIETIQTIIARLVVLENWENKGVSGTFEFFERLEILDAHEPHRTHSFKTNINHRLVAPKIIPILKEELLRTLQHHNAELAKLKERLTGVSEVKDTPNLGDTGD